MADKSLFSEFEPISAKQWKQKIQFDLKGDDYTNTLVWESLEGIKVKPFYNSEDLAEKPSFSLDPNHIWHVGQAIYAGNAVLANQKAVDVLSKGVASLVFQVPNTSVSIKKLLDGVNLEKAPIHFEFGFLAESYIGQVLDVIKEKKAQIYFNVDPVGNLASSGNWFKSKAKDHESLDSIFNLCKNKAGVSVFAIDTSLYQNAGANMVQQLAYGLAQANAYLNHFQNDVSTTKNANFTLKVALGGNYFFEIAKLRALRWLWQTLASEYDINTNCHILAIPTKRNKTLYDPNVNMLRTTSECMAAVLGGADTVCNLPYDALYHIDNAFGERIARNQLLLLKEESYFDEAVHAAEGNYYIESLTRQLAQKALELFKELEATGGFLKHLTAGTIQRKIRESAQKEQALFDAEKTVLVGTNKYENPDDRMKGNLELYPFLKTDKRQTRIAPIIARRLAERLEQQRLKEEH